MTLTSIDQRTWRGAAAVRILRWPKAAPMRSPTSGCSASWRSARAMSWWRRTTRRAWRAAITPLREAAAHFQAAKRHAIAGRGRIPARLRRTQPAARLRRQPQDRRTRAGAFRARPATRSACNAPRCCWAWRNSASPASMGPEVPRAEQRATLDTARARMTQAQRVSSKRRACSPMRLPRSAASRIRETARPTTRKCAQDLQKRSGARAARGDRYFEASATQNLGYIAHAGARWSGRGAVRERPAAHRARPQSRICTRRCSASSGTA